SGGSRTNHVGARRQGQELVMALLVGRGFTRDAARCVRSDNLGSDDRRTLRVRYIAGDGSSSLLGKRGSGKQARQSQRPGQGNKAHVSCGKKSIHNILRWKEFK